MSTQLPNRRRFHHLVLGSLAVPALLTQTSVINADETASVQVAQGGGTPAAAPAEDGKLDLPSCRRTALEKQPGIAAARATLAAAQARQQAIENMHLAGVIRHDLPFR